MRSVRVVMLSMAAAGVGACVALLLAPQTGQRTRRQIRRKTEDLVHQVREDLGSLAQDTYERGTRAAQQVGRRILTWKPKLAA